MSTPTEATEPSSDPTVVAVTTANLEANANSSQDDDAKARIRIGSQRQGSAPVKAAPRVVTEFKTGDAPNPQKQVFVRLDQEGNFQPLASASSPPAANENPPASPEVKTEADAAEVSSTPGEGFRPKPAPLAFTAKSDKPVIEKVGPKIAVPSTRGKLSDDLEAELAAALGEDGSLEEMIDKSAVKSVGATIEPDTKVTGKVLRVTREFVFVDLPGMNQGAIQTLLFEDRVPEVGAPLDVRVVRFIAEEGIYECTSGTAAISVADWSQVSEGMVVEARITGHNKGGLECEVNRLRGFIPAGQISLYRIEDFSTMVGEKLACVITQANPERRNLVLSRKAVLEREQEEAKGKLLAELEVGQEREGIVRSLRDFGAFVDLGGMDGLIHISQMSWERVKHPKDVLTEGQRVKVKIQKIDPTNGKISLSLRDFIQNPWDTAAQKYAVGTKIKGTVTRIMEFGAFVKLEPGVEGLVHVSELSYKRVWRVSDVLSEGQEVEAKVLAVDPEKQRISLSIKAYEAHPEPEAETETEVEAEAEVASKPVPKRNTPLKGGLSQGSGGEQFGLKW